MAANGEEREDFIRRCLIAVLLTAGVIILLALVAFGAHVLLLGFAGILVAIFLRSLAGALSRWTRLPEGWATLLTVVLLVGAVVGFGVWMAPSLIEQVQQSSERIPQAIDKLRGRLEQYTWGRWLIANMPSGTGQTGGLLGRLASFVSTTVGNVVNVLVVVFVGLYLTAQPTLYLNGLMRLVPPSRRGRVAMVLTETGYELRWWLFGQIIAMLLIATLVTLGLWALGIPMALLLGVIAGLLNFIPNFGPIISAVPAILLALVEDPTKAVWVVGLYIAAQHFETYLITPMIQQRNVQLPAVLTIIAQVLMGLFVGIIGVALATPLVIVVIVLVKMLYVEDALGDRLELPGENVQRIKDHELT
ncbi:MAG TPA: AI-2E family transporter [Planctomycetota bacterium]|nr:AI-2E family transporter [Planctomycetota bacterium]